MIIKTNGILEPNFSIKGHRLTNDNGDIETTLGGYDFTLTTLSEIMQEAIDQKHYEVPFADYVPVDVGVTPTADEIIRKVAFQTGGNFFKGAIDTNTSTQRMVNVDVAMSILRMPIATWAGDFQYNLLDVSQAIQANNYDLITEKTKSLKKNWDLGMQEVCFTGHPDVPEITGLLNSKEVDTNADLIPKKISEMDETEFQTFISKVIGAYAANSSYTSKPDTFVMPTDDYLGLASATSKANPAISKMEYLQKAFSGTTGNKNFKIMDLAYCQKEEMSKLTGKEANRYVLYKNDPEVLMMSIPIDFLLLDSETPHQTHPSGLWSLLRHSDYSSERSFVF